VVSGIIVETNLMQNDIDFLGVNILKTFERKLEIKNYRVFTII
jgi:hypothetical protein